MRSVYFISDSIYSPLGIGSGFTFDQLSQGHSGIRLVEASDLSDKPFYASVFSQVEVTSGFTRFEQIAFRAAKDAVANYEVDPKRTLFILSTTKGNVSQLSKKSPTRLNLHDSTKKIASVFGISNSITVSNACISGVMAMLIAQRFLANGKYDHALVVGAEELSKFIVSGFQSLFALSDSPCKPFDKDRTGITLGEAGGAVLLSAMPAAFGIEPQFQIAGGGISNDANHISGPSRTGLELAFAIDQALCNADLKSEDIDLLSAHGTATLYNDEMEAKAFHAAGLAHTPIHSLKAYFGHTLGAAGIIESIIVKECLRNNTLLMSKGFEESGVSQNLNVIKESNKKPLRAALKTASGFGGCNAAMTIVKMN